MQDDEGNVWGNSAAEANVLDHQPMKGREVSDPPVVGFRQLRGEEFFSMSSNFLLWHNISSAAERIWVAEIHDIFGICIVEHVC